jgi:hypothetical protein
MNDSHIRRTKPLLLSDWFRRHSCRPSAGQEFRFITCRRLQGRAAHCGTDKLLLTAHYGTDKLLLTAHCGTDKLLLTAHCGTDKLLLTAHCGADKLLLTALCGTDKLLLTAHCGTDKLLLTALCGTDKLLLTRPHFYKQFCLYKPLVKMQCKQSRRDYYRTCRCNEIFAYLGFYVVYFGS